MKIQPYAALSLGIATQLTLCPFSTHTMPILNSHYAHSQLTLCPFYHTMPMHNSHYAHAQLTLCPFSTQAPSQYKNFQFLNVWGWGGGVKSSKEVSYSAAIIIIETETFFHLYLRLVHQGRSVMVLPWCPQQWLVSCVLLHSDPAETYLLASCRQPGYGVGVYM